MRLREQYLLEPDTDTWPFDRDHSQKQAIAREACRPTRIASDPSSLMLALAAVVPRVPADARIFGPQHLSRPRGGLWQTQIRTAAEPTCEKETGKKRGPPKERPRVERQKPRPERQKSPTMMTNNGNLKIWNERFSEQLDTSEEAVQEQARVICCGSITDE